MKDILKYILFILVAGACIVLSTSCSRYTQPKAVEQMNKANNTYPGTVAELTRKWYPCITKDADTVLLTKDSLVYVDCPEIIPVPASDYGFAIETSDNLKIELNRPKEVVKYVKVPVTIPVRTQVITKYIEDSAKIKSMQIELSFTKSENYKLKQDLVSEKDKRQRNGWQRNWLLFFIIIYFTLRVLKGISKKATPAGFIGRVAKWVLKFII